MSRFSYREDEHFKPLCEEDLISGEVLMQRMRDKWAKEKAKGKKVKPLVVPKGMAFCEKEKDMSRLDDEGSGRL